MRFKSHRYPCIHFRVPLFKWLGLFFMIIIFCSAIYRSVRSQTWILIRFYLPRSPPLPEFRRADAGSWLGTKNALYYCAQSPNSFSWVLFVSSYTTAIVLPHSPGSFTKLVLARENFVFYFPNQKRRNYRWVEKKFGIRSAWAIQFAPRIFCFCPITMYRN